jgi:hypothetical protein
MSDWQIMVHQVDLGAGLTSDQAVPIPSGWEPIGLAARQGNKASILCRRAADVVPPAGAPVLTSLTPNSLPAGSTPVTVDVAGTGFDSSSTIQADGVPRVTFFLDATHLQYTARPDQATPGTVQITVQGGGGTSNAVTFTFT